MTSVATVTKNAALDAQTLNSCSLHSAFPGTTGASEISGGAPAYARKAITVAAAVGSQRLLSAAVTFDVPAVTVAWFGFWNGATWVYACPNGGFTPKNFVAVASEDKIYCPGHGYTDTQTITFYNGTAPGGLTEGTTYFVRDAATDSFKVAATSGGTAIDITSSASDGCWICRITVQVYAAQDTHDLTAFTYAWPN